MKKVILPVAFVLVVFALFLVPMFIKVKINCETQYGPCPKEITDDLYPLDLKSLSQARSGINQLLKKNYLVGDYSTHYKLPNILMVNILLRKPNFAVSDRTTKKVGTVGEDGNILSISDSSALPQVVTEIELEAGNKVPSDVLFGLNLISGVYNMYQVGKGEINGQSLIVELPPHYKVTFPLEGDGQLLLGKLRLTYAKLQSDEELGGYSEIDLRFKNPVLR